MANETARPRVSPEDSRLTERDDAPLRPILLALVLIGALGLTVELFLLEHIESIWQWSPFIALGATLVGGIVVGIRPGRRSIRMFQGIMLATAAIGLIGIWLHYQGNTEFELESDPTSTGFLLIWRSLRGATPALAPGALIQLALLGLIFAYRHPALTARRATATPHDPSQRRDP